MKRVFALLLSLVVVAATAQERIKVGIIGLDTSHSPAFIKHLNAEKPDSVFAGFQVVAAYPYGSKSIESSYKRIPGYTEEAKKHGVKIVESIEELLSMVDCVLLETNDGNCHLEQAELVFKAKKPMFIDKPIGANLAQTLAIVELSKRYGSPFFSSSALRFSVNTEKIRSGRYGKVHGAYAYSPAPNEPSHADLYWYGIHGVESLFAVMGKGCKSVQASTHESADVATAIWEDGRLGQYRGVRAGKQVFGGTAYCENRCQAIGGYEGYAKLLENILNYFRTGKAPVEMEETVEIYTFMEAVNQSKRQGGKAVEMSEVRAKAEKQVAKLLKKR